MAGVIRQFTISGQVTLSPLQKERKKYPRRDLSTRDSSTAPLLISFLIVKRIRLASPSKKSLENYVRIALLSIPPFGRAAISIASTL